MPRYLVKHYFCVSVRVFLAEISIWISRRRKVDGLPQCGWASSNLLRAGIEQKDRGRRNLPLFSALLLELGHLISEN